MNRTKWFYGNKCDERAWTARLAAAHTIPREFADEDYIFDPLRFKNLKIPTLLLLGSKSPDVLKAATEAVHAVRALGH